MWILLLTEAQCPSQVALMSRMPVDGSSPHCITIQWQDRWLFSTQIHPKVDSIVSITFGKHIISIIIVDVHPKF